MAKTAKTEKAAKKANTHFAAFSRVNNLENLSENFFLLQPSPACTAGVSFSAAAFSEVNNFFFTFNHRILKSYVLFSNYALTFFA